MSSDLRFAGDESCCLSTPPAPPLHGPRLTAGRWLLAALRVLAPDEDVEQRLELLVEAATALTSGGAYEESLAALEDALALVSPTQVRRRAELIAKLAYAKRRSGRPFDSRVMLENALESLPPGDSPPALSRRLELALDRFWHDDFHAMSDLAGRLLLAALEPADLPMISLSAALGSLAASSEPRVADALAKLTEARNVRQCSRTLSYREAAEALRVRGATITPGSTAPVSRSLARCRRRFPALWRQPGARADGRTRATSAREPASKGTRTWLL